MQVMLYTWDLKNLHVLYIVYVKFILVAFFGLE